MRRRMLRNDFRAKRTTHLVGRCVYDYIEHGRFFIPRRTENFELGPKVLKKNYTNRVPVYFIKYKSWFPAFIYIRKTQTELV